MNAVFGAGAVALGAAVFVLKSRWNYLRLPALPVAEKTSLSAVTVVIPARNEAAQIARVVGSFPDVPVLVVDDASTDDTAALARAAGAQVIPAPPLRPGLLGKPNACAAGAQAASTEWLLFVDADTWYKPAFLSSLLAYAQQHHLDMATVFLRQECVTVPERILLPYAFALYFCGVSAANVNSAQSAEALANGQCILFRRHAYERLGGHAAVADSIIEDVALAAVAKRAKVSFRVLRAEALGSVRMYDGFTAIWRGFEKNSFRFLLVNPWCGVQVILASVLLTSYVPMLVWLLREGQPLAALLFALWPVLLFWPWYGTLLGSLAAPAAIYLFQLIALQGMVTTTFGRKALWKGRRV